MYIYIFKNALYPSESRKVVTNFPVKDRNRLMNLVNEDRPDLEWQNLENARRIWVLVDIHT